MFQVSSYIEFCLANLFYHVENEKSSISCRKKVRDIFSLFQYFLNVIILQIGVCRFVRSFKFGFTEEIEDEFCRDRQSTTVHTGI